MRSIPILCLIERKFHLKKFHLKKFRTHGAQGRASPNPRRASASNKHICIAQEARKSAQVKVRGAQVLVATSYYLLILAQEKSPGAQVANGRNIMNNGEHFRKIRASAQASARKGAQGRARRAQVRASPAAPSYQKSSRASGRARPFSAAAQERASDRLDFCFYKT